VAAKLFHADGHTERHDESNRRDLKKRCETGNGAGIKQKLGELMNSMHELPMVKMWFS
jgi:hypothetical protein